LTLDSVPLLTGLFPVNATPLASCAKPPKVLNFRVVPGTKVFVVT
jgi:hypothetical protein